MSTIEEKDIIIQALIAQIRETKKANAALEERLARLDKPHAGPAHTPKTAPAAHAAPAPKAAAPEAAKKPAPAAKPAPVAVESAPKAKTTKAPAASHSNAAAAAKHTLPKGPFDDFKAYLTKWENHTTKPATTAQIEADCRTRFPEIQRYAESTLRAKIQDILGGRVKAKTLCSNKVGYWSVDVKADNKAPAAPAAKPKAQAPAKAPAAPAAKTAPASKHAAPAPAAAPRTRVTPDQAKKLEGIAKTWVAEWWSSHNESSHSQIAKDGAEKHGFHNSSKWQDLVREELQAQKAAGKIGAAVGRGYFLVTNAHTEATK